MCTNPTTSATIVRHVRDYSEKRSFDDKPASKVASPGRSSRSERAAQKFADRAFSPIDGPRGINERVERRRETRGVRGAPLGSFRIASRNSRFDDVFFPIASMIFFRRFFLGFLRFLGIVRIREYGKELEEERETGLVRSRCKLTIKPCKVRERGRRRRRPRRGALTGKNRGIAKS